MCGRLRQGRDSARIAAGFEAGDLVRTEARELAVTLAPSQTLLTVLVAAEAGRQVVTCEWGLIPHWARDDRGQAHTFNARAETVAEKPTFRDAFRRRRCLIPAEVFYEWARQPDGRKQPHAIGRADGQPLALAGLWSVWTDPASGASRRTCTIVTTEANATLRPLHHRMPVVVAEADWDRWLDPATPDDAGLRALLRPCPDDLLEARPVGAADTTPAPGRAAV